MNPIGSKLSRQSSPPWGIIGATIWLLFFVACALTLELPNNRSFARWDFLSLVPELIDLIDPPPPRPSDSPQTQFVREHSGWRYFPQRLDPYAVAGVILAGAWGTGHLLLRAIRVPLLIRSLERTIFAVGLGLSCLSLVTLLAGLAGALSRSLLGGIILAAFGAEIVLQFKTATTNEATSRRMSGDARSPFARSATSWNSLGEWSRSWLWLIVPAPFLLAMLLGAALPSVDFDVNEYHFQGPKEYFQNGRISFLPHNVYTSFPFCTEMLTLLAMVLRNDWYQGALAGKCVLMTFGPLTGLALYAAGRRWFGPVAGGFAAALYLTTPWTYRISTIAYTEGGLSFFLIAALVALRMAFENASRDRDRRHVSRIFLVAGALAGTAMACKYPGVVSVVIPLFAAIVWRTFFEQKESTVHDDAAQSAPIVPNETRSMRSSMVALRSSAVPFVVGVVLTIGPWLAKNTAETGNPVYPLLYTVFGGRDWDAELNAKWRHGHSPSQFALWGNEPQKMSLAYSAVDVTARNDWVNSLMFACAAFTWFSRDLRRRTAGLWLYYGYLFLTWWLLTHRLDRFWVPMTPVLALLAGGGAAWFWNATSLDRLNPPWGAFGFLSRASFGVCLATVTAINLVMVVSPLGGYNDFLLDMEQSKKRAANIESPEIVLLNERLPPGSKVLSVGDAEMFETRFPVVYNTVFDHSIFEQWTAEESTLPHGERLLRPAEVIREKLAAEGITHIYVNWQEILRYREPGSYGYTDFVAPGRFAELQRLGVIGPAWSIPEATMPVERLSPDQQAELRRFAPELISTVNGVEVFTTYQVFPVLVR